MLFADDAMFYLIANDLNEMINNINDDLDNLYKYLSDNNKSVIFSNENVGSTYDNNVNILISSILWEQGTEIEYLGVVTDENPNMHCQKENLMGKMFK